MAGERNSTRWHRGVLSIQPQRFTRIVTPTIFASVITGVLVSSIMVCTAPVKLKIMTPVAKKWTKRRESKRREVPMYPVIPTRNPAPGKLIVDTKKLALVECLQATLVTKAGLTENQFDHIWDKVA